MRIEFGDYAIQNALKFVAKVQPRGEDVGPHGMTLVTSDESGVWLTGTSLDTWVRHPIERATADAHGEVLLSTEHLQNVMGQAPGSSGRASLTIDTHNPGAIAEIGVIRMKIPGRPAADYPRVRDPEEPAASAKCSGDRLREALRSVAWACSRETSRPLLQCVHLTVRDGVAVFEATSGFEFGVVRAPWLQWPEGKPVVIRQEFARLLGEFAAGEHVEISHGGGWLTCTTNDGARFMCRTESGPFPDFHRVIAAAKPVATLEVAGPTLLRSVEVAKATAPLKNHACRFEWEGGRLVMRASSLDAGETVATLDAMDLGDARELKVAMDGSRTIAALKALGADAVRWSSAGVNRIQTFQDGAPEEDSPELMVGVMPLNWEMLDA